MAEILHHPRCHPNFEIMGVAEGNIKDAIMLDMAGGAGFKPSTVLVLVLLVVVLVLVPVTLNNHLFSMDVSGSRQS